MTKNELIDRYIYAVARKLPAASRKDIETELRGLISDMLDERCGDLTPTETDVKVVLTELGTPSELALKYDPDGERSLIGPKYFRPWLKVLTIVLAAETGGMLIASVIGVLSGEISGGWAQIIAEIIGMIWNGALSAFAMVTLIFAIFQYKNFDFDKSDDFSNLPAVPQKNEKISRVESIIGIVGCVILLPLMLYIPHKLIIGAVESSDGTARMIHLFTENAFSDAWYLLVIGFGAAIVLDIIKLVIGRYNYRVAVASTICNVISCITVAFSFLRVQAYDTQLTDSIRNEFIAEGKAVPTDIINNLPMTIGIAITTFIVIVSLAEVISCWVKAVKYSKE